MLATNHRLCSREFFFDIAELSDNEFAEMDIGMLIMANMRRYIGLISSLVGPLSDIERSELPGIFFDVGYKPLKKKQTEHLSSDGEERKRALLGTLKAIAQTRVVQYLRRKRSEFVRDVQLEDGTAAILFNHYDSSTRSDTSSSPYFEWQYIDTVQHTLSGDPTESLMFAAEEAALPAEAEPDHYDFIKEGLEELRHLLPTSQYVTLRDLVDNDFASSAREMADEAGCNERKIFARLAEARKKLFENLTPEQQKELKDTLYRKARR